jgi:colanic acid biosynthesis protein WcaH
MMGKKLGKKQFLEVLKNTPLVSIDLVIKDLNENIWLGKRVNEPAKGKWFVPGGRIYKGENLGDAFERITQDEVGFKYSIKEARLLGAFTHIYENNVFQIDGISTHYVALAYEILLTNKTKIMKLNGQHSEHGWFARNDVDPFLNTNPDYEVHENTLVYFRIP